LVKITKTIEMGLWGFYHDPNVGVNSPWPQQWGRSKKKNERQDETQFITKIVGKTSLCLSYFVL